MKISYNWLKAYIPELVEIDKLSDVFNYHLCEVEGVEKIGDGEKQDSIFDINILPNRAHDLLSHRGVARELASQLNIPFVDPTPMYKIPPLRQLSAGQTELKIVVESNSCRRYMGRIVRNVTVGPSPEWVVSHLESIGQRSINNIVDAANIVMYDCGQPIHAFDLDKISGNIVVRQAREGEEITTLDNKQVKLKPSNLVIADDKNVLAIAGVKGGKVAEVDAGTKNVVIEIANFDPVSVRKTARGINIFTDSAKRFENDLSPELCDFAMLEMSGLLVECGFTDFEEIVDVYTDTTFKEQRKLTFSLYKVSSLLGREISVTEVFNILNRYNISYTEKEGDFEIIVPPLRLDLNIPEDMVEEIGRIIGYSKVQPRIPKIDFVPKVNDVYAKTMWARNKLLNEGYSEVMTYSFTNKGEVSVLASASDKKFLRTNLKDGLEESLKVNQVNLLLLNAKEVKIFEIGTVFGKNKEAIHIAYGDKKEVKEVTLDEYADSIPPLRSLDTPPQEGGEGIHPLFAKKGAGDGRFEMWPLFPFIARDIALWVPESVLSIDVANIIKENMGGLVVKGPELFDEFKKDGKVSYAFRLVFQSFDRTLTDYEINEVVDKITNKLKENSDWELR